MLRYTLGLAAFLILVPVSLRADDMPDGDDSDIGKETVKFAGDMLVLAFETEGDGEELKEYIPAGEKLDSWTKLAAIRLFADLDDPHTFGEGMVRALEQRTPKPQYELRENSETGAVLLTFVVWPEDESFVEFNIFKIEKDEDGGLVSYQYALRGYDDTEKFLDDLTPEMRKRLQEEMVENGLDPDDDDDSDDKDEKDDVRL